MSRMVFCAVFIFVLISLFLALRVSVHAAAQEDTEPQGPAVRWRTDWEAARKEAVAQNKPLFVRFRCFKMPPDLAQLDAEIEKPTPGSLLQKLLAEKYVPVRLGSIKGVDLNTFRFDYDLQMAGLVLDGRDSATLTRWGTRDAKSATSRISAQGLSTVLEQAAKTYAARTPDRANAASATTAPLTLDKAFPAFAQSKRMNEPCWHCHYANDARLANEKAAGTLRKKALFMYPLPETIGLRCDKNAGNLVSSVLPASPAQKAGIHVGDSIVQAGSQPIYSSADLQAVLNDLPNGSLFLQIRRGNSGKKIGGATLYLAPGWREAEDISWRPSQGAVPPILGTWETPLSAEERKAAGLPEKGGLALRVSFVFAGEKWAASHGDLQINDVIIAVNGQSPPIENARQFHTWYRLHNEVGQTANFIVLRGGKKLTVPVGCVDVSL